MKVIIIRTDDITNDVRVIKEVRILSQNKFSVAVLGWDRKGVSSNHETHEGYAIDRIKIRSSFGSGIKHLIPLILWMISEFIYLLHSDFDIVHACDFDTVIPAYCVARIKHRKIVYDIFDFCADSVIGVPIAFKKMIEKLELFYINKVDAVIVCDENRKERIRGYGKSVSVFYNTPEDIFSELKSKFRKINNKNFIITYMGLLDNRSRDVLQVIKAVSRMENITFKIAGYGISEQEISSISKQNNYIKFLGQINHKQALEEEYKSNAIVCIYNPSIIANIYASPNKLFEAMMLSKPVIMNRGIKAAELIEKYNIGVLFNYGDIESLNKAITMLQDDKHLYNTLAYNARQLYENKYSTLPNAKHLLNIYRKIL